MRIVEKLRSGANLKIKDACERLSPKNRFVIVVSVFVVFATISLLMVINSFYDLGIEKRELDIEHMKELELKWAPKDTTMYNQIKEYFHDGTIK